MGKAKAPKINNKGVVKHKMTNKEALRNALIFNKEIISSAGVGIVVYDSKFRYKEWNKYMEDLTGYSKKDVLNQCGFDLFPHLREQGIDKLLYRAMEGETVISHDTPFLIPKTKSFGWVIGVYSPHRNSHGKIAGVIGMITDVTKRKLAENKIQEEKETAQKYLEIINVLVMILDRNGNVVLINRKGCEILGYRNQEILHKNWFDNFLPQRIKVEIRDFFQKIITGEKEFVEYHENPVLTNSGEERIIAWHNILLRNRNNMVIGILTSGEDVTDRKAAEEKNMRLAAIVESSDDAIIGKDLNGLIHFWNQGAEKMYGYKESEVLGKPITLLIPEEYHNEARQFLKKIKRGEHIEHYETVRLRKDGNLIDVSLTISPIRDGKGSVIGISTIARDITQRKKIEKVLRESEARYRILFDKSPDGMVISGIDGKILVVNQAIEINTGYAVEEFETINAGSMYADAAQRNQMVALLKKDGRVRDFEAVFKRKDGSVFYTLMNVDWIELEGRKYLLTTIRDITALREAQGALKTSEEKFFKAFKVSPALMLITSLSDARYLEVNEAFEKKTGYRQEEVIGRFLLETGIFNNPEDLLQIVQDLTSGKEIRDLEYQFRMKNGELRIGLLSATLLKLRGEFCVLSVVTDITDRKQMEQKLSESYQNLEAKVQKRTVELKEANKKLQETSEELKKAMKIKSDFLANMSHELRTPLNSINGFSEVLYDETFGTLNQKQKEYLNYILISGRHLLSLINDVLDLAKMEAGKEKLKLSIIFIKDLLEESMALVKEMAFRKEIATSLEIPEDIGYIEADERKFKEVVYNLLSNAIKFTPGGGQIGIRAKRSESEVRIEVYDTGIGILAENIGKMFEPFVRLEAPQGKVIEGTGLGLAYSKKLVELHGGNIWAESKGLNQGSVFIFTLPVQGRQVK